MISAVAEMYEIHPQTLRLYEREGLLKPSRTEGNTRLYTEEDIERLEFIEKPLAPRKPFRFHIPPPPRGGQRAISLEGVHMAYGTNKVYAGLDLTIERGERTVLVGPNGAPRCLADSGFLP